MVEQQLRHTISVYCKPMSQCNFDHEKPKFNVEDLSIYIIDIPTHVDNLSVLYDFLTETEKLKLEKYRQLKDRERFIIGKAHLKQLISLYLNINTESIDFILNENQKPFVKGFSNLNFNVSHSGNKIAIAISKHPLGIDIEKIDYMFDFQSIIKVTFSNAERNYIENSKNKHSDFYMLWTRKESIVKATSKGIDDNFCKVPCLEGIHTIQKNEIESEKSWIVTTKSIETDYILSLAYESVPQPIRIKLFNWSKNLNY